jgi:hypothetical protein
MSTYFNRGCLQAFLLVLAIRDQVPPTHNALQSINIIVGVTTNQHINTPDMFVRMPYDDVAWERSERHLFLQPAKRSQLHDPKHEAGPFKLFCDDLRPTNFLVDADFRIVAVIDWEFTYAAPAEFAHSPPFWLLLERPEYWPEGLSDWAAAYEPRLQIFLRVLVAREQARIEDGTLGPENTLSARVRESWERGDFWTIMPHRGVGRSIRSIGDGLINDFLEGRRRMRRGLVFWRRRKGMTWIGLFRRRWSRVRLGHWTIRIMSGVLLGASQTDSPAISLKLVPLLGHVHYHVAESFI